MLIDGRARLYSSLQTTFKRDQGLILTRISCSTRNYRKRTGQKHDGQHGDDRRNDADQKAFDQCRTQRERVDRRSTDDCSNHRDQETRRVLPAACEATQRSAGEALGQG